MKRILMVISLPGAGKSSIVGGVMENIGKKYKHANFGDIMVKVGLKSDKKTTSDTIKFLSNDSFSKNIDAVVSEIAKMNGDIILTRHVTSALNGKFMPSIKMKEKGKMIQTVGIIFIDAPTDQILSRRKRDSSRVRELPNAWFIDHHRAISVALLSIYAAYINKPLYIIDNKDGELESSRKLFLQHMKDAFGEK